jgi:inner membrane transporter RhtA
MKAIATRLSVPPAGLVILSVISTQIGSAVAKTLFAQVGATGMVFLRVVLAALILGLMWRPTWPKREHFAYICAFGCSFAVMNFSFYAAIERIPLGIAVALEFMGPLGLAAFKSRRWLDGVWVLLAALGVFLLAPWGQGATQISPVGVGWAMLAAVGWASYILLSAQVGKQVPGIGGLTWAMAFGACLLAPLGIGSAGRLLLEPRVIAIATFVALMASALPYTFELIALRTLPINTFGILLALEPMAAALVGFLILGETLTAQVLVAIALISIAAAGASGQNRT